MIKLIKSKKLMVLMFVLGSGLLFGQAYFNALLPGTEPVSARALGMGATSLAASDGYGNLWSNPALLNGGSGMGMLTLTGGIIRREEQRSLVVKDYFDDVVVDNIYATNRNWYDDFTGGLVINLPFHISLGLARSNFWDWRYDYIEEVRGELAAGNYNRDPLRGYHLIERKGAVMATSAGLSLMPVKNLRLGLVGHFLSAPDINERWGVIVIEEDDALAATDTTIYDSELELDGMPMMLGFGAAYRVLPRLQVAFNYRSGIEFEIGGFHYLPNVMTDSVLPGYSRVDSSCAITYNLPAVVSFGLEAHLRNPIATRAMVEARRTGWSNYSLGFDVNADSSVAQNFNFEDTWEIHVGIEHVLLDELPFRFGMVFSQSPLGQEFETSLVTVGGSYKLGPAILDIGASFGVVEYKYEDIFIAVSQDADNLELETVHETSTLVQVGLTIPF